MNAHEDIIARLRSLGRRPVDDEIAGRQLAALAQPTESAKPAARAHRFKIVAAFAVGLLVGTTGLATAGALPNGAQEVAHRALGSVGVNVPHGDRYQGPECGGAVKNHGQYVRSQPKGKRAEVAASRCGKPVQAGEGDSDTKGGPAGSECHGPPPWAGKGKPDPAAKAARRAACGGMDDESDDDSEDENGSTPTSGPAAGIAPAVPAGSPSDPTTTTTTEPVTTTTTAPASTTTTVTGPTTTTVTTPAGTEPGQESTTTTSAGGSAGPSPSVTLPGSGSGS